MTSPAGVFIIRPFLDENAAMPQTLFRVIFHNAGKIYELYAEGVGESGLYGFVEVEGLRFGERSELLVDPAEERLKSEFEGVERLYLPMHAIVRIDEVNRAGPARIHEGGGKITPFPPVGPKRGE